MTTIHLKNIKVYAYHGCLAEEAKIGSAYRVDLSVVADLSKSIASDALEDTIDYVTLSEVVVSEMKIRSKLLEHVLGRIMTRIFNTFADLEEATVSIAKINPPIGGDVASVSVSQTLNRKQILCQ